MEKEETPYIVPKYHHLLAAWTKFETFYLQIFCLKKRKSADQRKIFISAICTSRFRYNLKFLNKFKLNLN
jgi:hypothetical protein